MKHFHKYFAGYLILAAACNSDEFKPADIGLDYFPLQTGSYHVYAVDEILYSEVQEPEMLAYQLRVEINDSFPNTEGGYTYVIHRRKRTNETDPWQDLDTWSARENERELVVHEGNTAFVKLTFPLKKGNAWNGNKFNNLNEDEYIVEAMDEPFTAGGTTFENTVHVIQEDNDDVIVYFDQREEVYAKSVGLIYREIAQLNYCTDDSCIGQQIIKSGKIYKQEILEYGNL